MKRPAIDLHAFLNYKFFNSLFTGLSVGSVFTLYAPLEPSVFSLGGVALAVGMLLIAKLYVHIMNRQWFYRISMGVELVMLALVGLYLVFDYGYATALGIYIGYQLTFAFGSYLVRAETMLIPHRAVLTFLDVAKQKGYLAGMALAYAFYKVLENYLGIVENAQQVYALHALLLLSELATIALLYQAFNGLLRKKSL